MKYYFFCFNREEAKRSSFHGDPSFNVMKAGSSPDRINNAETNGSSPKVCVLFVVAHSQNDYLPNQYACVLLFSFLLGFSESFFPLHLLILLFLSYISYVV